MFQRPAFFAYRFLAELYSERVLIESPRVIVTKKGANVEVLLWDYSPPKADAPNNPICSRDLPATALPDAVLSFAGLAQKFITLRQSALVGTGMMSIEPLCRSANQMVHAAI